MYTGKVVHVKRYENIKLQGASYINLSHKMESSSILLILALIQMLMHHAVANKTYFVVKEITRKQAGL